MHNIILPNDAGIAFAVEMLSFGELVAFPTETVYGLGGNAYSDDVVAKIFTYKNRSEFNPISICYQSLEHASQDVVITKNAQIISDYFLPGPITILLKRRQNSKLSLLCSAGMDTIGIRIPANQIAVRLLSSIEFPLAAPSANKSTKLSTTTADAVSDSLKDNADLIILDGGKCNFGIESTIIDCSTDKLRIHRIGAVTVDEISIKCGLKIENEKIEINETTKNLKHYKPTKEIILNASEARQSDALLAFGAPFNNKCAYVLNLSPSENIIEAAANFFAMLLALDKTDAKRICIMPIPNIGIGIAINDRLTKACQ